ncbi:hypothetical protein ACWEQ4_01130 [Rhodococcus sp. NPDC003994]
MRWLAVAVLTLTGMALVVYGVATTPRDAKVHRTQPQWACVVFGTAYIVAAGLAVATS